MEVLTGALISAGSIVLGWSLNEISRLIARSRESRDARGVALSHLFHYYSGIRYTKELCKYINHEIPPKVQAQQALDLYNGHMKSISERKEKLLQAVGEIAKDDPVLSNYIFMRVIPIINLVDGLNKAEALKSWEIIEKSVFSETEIAELESFILGIAWKYSLLTWYRMRKALRVPWSIEMKDAENMRAVLNDLAQLEMQLDRSDERESAEG